MNYSEIEDFLTLWPIDQEKGFKYYDYGLFDAEYVVIQKCNDNLYKIIYEKSTCKDGPFNKEAMGKLLSSKRLVSFGNDGYHINFKRTKSGPCECGAWATRNPTCHTRWCPAHRWEG